LITEKKPTMKDLRKAVGVGVEALLVVDNREKADDKVGVVAEALLVVEVVCVETLALF